MESTFKNLDNGCTVFGYGNVHMPEKEYSIEELENILDCAKLFLNGYNGKTEKFLKEVLQNLPEYSQSFDCIEYHYEDCIFVFSDIEDGKKYTVILSDFIKGYDILYKLWKEKKSFFIGIDTYEDWEDAGQWDCDVVDCLIQCSIFGEIIYG